MNRREAGRYYITNGLVRGFRISCSLNCVTIQPFVAFFILNACSGDKSLQYKLAFNRPCAKLIINFQSDANEVA